MTPAPRKLLIDTDTASDDAVALIMALRSPAVSVEAITIVAGNVPLRQGVSNALYTVELCHAKVPVYAGAEVPLHRPLEVADWFHGKDGLGDHGYRPAHPVEQKIDAIEAIVATARANPGLEIVTLGPLTNLALALEREPSLPELVSRCVVMGGAPCCEGNVTPAAEFNLWVDPEAARRVFLSKLKLELVGWQLSRFDAVLSENDIAEIAALNTALGNFSLECNSTAKAAYFTQTGEHGISLPDPIAMALLLQPELSLEATDHYTQIEARSELTRGMSLVDRLNVSGDERNAAMWAETRENAVPTKIHWAMDVPGWKQLLIESLR
ncbi:MAG: nucleoside hydrolase [Acidobacteriaceae bacterium]|nr:nucleoside hydrolase [Acidobacteriaceae bacterium]